MASPYQLNPINTNPLRDLVEESIDFTSVRACTAFELFISATNVETGKVKVFPREELTADIVMASACLPNLYQAVETDGIPYWDGGYMGNPSLFPFRARLQDLREARNRLGERYGALQTGTSDAWDELKTGFSESWTAFSDAWSAADEEAPAN